MVWWEVLDAGFKVGQEVNLKKLEEGGWKDCGETRRDRKIFVKKDGGVTTGLLLDPKSNRIVLITKF